MCLFGILNRNFSSRVRFHTPNKEYCVFPHLCKQQEQFKYHFYAFFGHTWCTSHNRSDPPSRLNMMNKSRKNMKKFRTLIGSLYPLGKYMLRVRFALQNTSAPGHFVAPPQTSPPKRWVPPVMAIDTRWWW